MSDVDSENAKHRRRVRRIVLWGMLAVAVMVLVSIGPFLLVPLLMLPFLLGLATLQLAKRVYFKRTGESLASGRASLLFACAVNVFVVLHTVLELMTFPRGEAIRPMDLTAMYFLVAVATPIVALPLAVRALLQRRTAGTLVPILAIILSLTPILVGGATMFGIVAFRDLTLKP
jgi:hypothetical protein